MFNPSSFNRIKYAVERSGAALVAVTKQRPAAVIRQMYDLGQRDFGENRVDELCEKYAALPKDIRWHFIGHLQRNKVKIIAPFVHLIHSGDSARLLRTINKQAAENDRKISVLLQFHIASESSKYGLDPNNPNDVLDQLAPEDRRHLNIAGVMGMATYTDDKERISGEFSTLQALHTHLKADHFADEPAFREISMGMSGDYPIALAHGSTMVRVGSLLYEP